MHCTTGIFTLLIIIPGHLICGKIIGSQLFSVFELLKRHLLYVPPLSIRT